MRPSLPLLALMALLAPLFSLSTDASAQDLLKQKTYHFGTHPARTNITFVSEADLETIHGISHAMGGSITVDASGKKASGKLQVGAAAAALASFLLFAYLRRRGVAMSGVGTD